MRIYKRPLRLLSLSSTLLVLAGGSTAFAAQVSPMEDVRSDTLIAGAFNPPNRGMPASTQDGGTRGSFNPANRGMPASTQDGGTRGSFNPANRGMPASTQDGGTRGAFDPPPRGMPASTQDGGTRGGFALANRGMPASTQDGGTRGEFAPANRGMPASTQDGGTRTGMAHKVLQTLVPPNAMPLTLEEHPTFFWYMPEMAGVRLEFTLLDETDETIIYSTRLAMPHQAGMMYLQLPQEEQYALQAGETYHWYVSVVRNPNDRTGDAFVDGWVERLESDDPLAQAVAGLNPAENTQAFSDNGLWYESFEHWAQKREQTTADWQEFLQSVNLEQYAQVPFIDASELPQVAQDSVR
ncbi:DUF928 domain-containing protein [Spirulina sp. CS-785/01]|uniref:DUF928 domain-containing protein n=1 Tax=Spirulina sp. CS-785/01 TaxID=3021716 RepID=UPI00232ABDAD|nr:DUF928 domain-containing protein [Spirulina sp. CS-785/01]MDB9315000.1 DUF928 domain-containing protein [Spirulina sp. CS-785/01]